MRVYEITSDTTPAYNPDDFTSAEWLMPQNLLARIESGDPSKTDLPILVRRFYG